MKTFLLILCVCFMALVSAPASVSAGTIDVAVTGQTECFDAGGAVIPCATTGQDGETQTGVRWPNPRFTDNSDGTVTDNLTGLMWLEDANCILNKYSGYDLAGLVDGLVFWQTALDFVNGINDNTHADCQAGHTDWRLPNIHELKSLVDHGTDNPALPAGHPFDTLLASYWSSTTYSNGDPASRDKAWAITFDEGQITNGSKTGSKGIWPVRDSGAAGVIELPRTRQAGCYDENGAPIPDCTGTGQDAEFNAGVAWPDPRFTANGDGTVTDNLTGLIWLADVTGCMGGSDNWDNAFTTVTTLNANPANFHGGGCDYTGMHDDWRLANIRELESIVHFDFTEEGIYISTAAWLNGLDVGFEAVALKHWASTSNSVDKSKAWTANFAPIGQTFAWPKTDTHYIWPVRGGVYGDPDISVTPATIDFGEVTIGSSADRDITIANEGTYYLALDTIAAPAAPFSITADGCSALDLYPADTCTVTVRYEPTAEGAGNENVDVTSDDPDEATVVVPLSGTGTVAAAEAEPNNPPAAFDLVYPADGATGLSMPVTIIWKATTDPDGDPITYDVVYCEDNTFATCTPMTNIASVKRESRWMKFAKGWITSLATGPLSLMGCGGGATTPTDDTSPDDTTPSVNADEFSYQATDLNPGTTYYWKVTANDANGGATESAVWSFTTE